jgi:hypothetical protein
MAGGAVGWSVAGALVWAMVIQTQTPAPLKVIVDVKPGDNPTTIEKNRGGMLPVAVISTAKFDATTIDPSSVRIGPPGTEAEAFKTTNSDADEDGRNDFLILVRLTDLNLKCTDTVIKLTGMTKTGIAIEGSETGIKITGCQ